MEKNLLITNLKTKAGVDNLSERTYDEVATAYLPLFTDDDKITDESWNIPVQVLKTMSGQLRHEVADGITKGKTQWETEQQAAQQKAIDDAIAAAKAQWEKDHLSQQQQQQQQQQQPDIAKLVAEQVAEQMKGFTGENSDFGKLTKQFSEYLAAQSLKDKAATEEGIRSQIKAYLIGRGVEEDDYALEIALEKLVIGDNADIAALKTKAETDYEAIFKRMHQYDGAQPYANRSRQNGELSPLIKSHLDRVAQETKDAAEYKESIQFAK